LFFKGYPGRLKVGYFYSFYSLKKGSGMYYEIGMVVAGEHLFIIYLIYLIHIRRGENYV